MIDLLRSSDAGDYQCIVNITQSDTGYQFSGTKTAQVIITLPTPSVIVEYNATGHLVDGELVEGQFLDIMCIADISQYIDTRSSVSVTMSWRRNNTVLTNGSDFTISPPVMTNNQYTGVLRINSLRDELDNGASYNCSVSVTPGPSLIAGNDNSSAVTLTVARFDVNHVDISIKTPVPVAGNVFNLSCVIVVPPNFVEDLTSVRWTYDLAASQDVTSENNDATLVPVDRNGNIFTSVLTLDPVKTTDARQYYCQAAFIAFGTVDRTNKDLVVQISPPSVSIVADPPTGPIYESTGYLLTCTATVDTTIVNIPVTASVVWTDPSGNVIPTNEARRQVIPPTGNSLISMLLFQPIDTGHNNDGGTYTCQMTVNSGNSLIASSQTTNTTLDITVESLPPMTVDFSSVGSVEVGQSLTILCTIITIERLVVTPLITVIKMNDTDMEVISNKLYTITTDETGSVTNYALILDPVRFEDAGMYTCMAEFNVTGYNNTDDPSTATYDSQEASDVYNLTVHFPPVIVTIAKERDDTLYAGTSFFIKCDIMLDPLVTIPVTVTNQWTRDGTNVPMGSSDATITEGLNMINTLHYNATLMFYPLDNADDSGMYTCNVEVTAPNSYTYLRSTSASITVMAIPRPVVEIVAMGITEPGEEYMLNCTVTVLDRLIVSPVIIWTKRSASNVINVPPVLMNISNVLSSLYLRFSSLNTSDAGLYTCEASINISQIPIVARSNDTSKLPLKIPIPAVDVSRSRDSNFLAGSNLILTLPTPSVIVEYNATGQLVDGELAEGQFLDIMCIADISQYIDTGVSVTLTWRRNNTVLTNGSDFTISPPVMTNNQYTGVLRINSLRDELDNGATYNCLVSVTPNTPIIIAGNDNSSAVTLTVARFDINHVDISINISSVPVAGDVFNLSCVIVVPPNFVEDLTTVRWTYNLEVSQFVTSENNDATLVPVVRNGSIFTSVLTLDPVKATDARQYYCQATILVFGTVDRTNRDLTVQIFPPSVSIVADPPTGPIYESTGYLLTCTATVNTTIVDTPVTASVVWTDPSGNVIPTNETRRQVIPPTGNSLVSMLLFLPIDTGLNNDGGTYTCQMIINSGSSLLASSQATNTTLDVTVESLPPMTVDFSSDGSVEVGQSLTITCTIITVERLVVTPLISFFKLNNTDIDVLSNLNRPYSITIDETGSVTNYTLILDPVRFEDAGMHTCMAEFN
ncbi:PREDICTED: uncharacterized protein LOC105312652, partial [Amphimedon queenslandica]|uniref:Ig-like domain-containing protein n=1 Tax=Amphimedon queenslandica TaxID=400682 RepID=A0AAN0J3P9_AMPQE